MKIKESIQSIIINRKPSSQIQIFRIFEKKNRTRFFIGSAIIITFAAFYQTGTRAQFLQGFSTKTKPAQTSLIIKKEIDTDTNLEITRRRRKKKRVIFIGWGVIFNHMRNCWRIEIILQFEIKSRSNSHGLIIENEFANSIRY